MSSVFYVGGRDGDPSRPLAPIVDEAGNPVGLELPQGAIILWARRPLPSGWLLCDGQDGRPDLRGAITGVAFIQKS